MCDSINSLCIFQRGGDLPLPQAATSCHNPQARGAARPCSLKRRSLFPTLNQLFRSRVAFPLKSIARLLKLPFWPLKSLLPPLKSLYRRLSCAWGTALFASQVVPQVAPPVPLQSATSAAADGTDLACSDATEGVKAAGVAAAGIGTLPAGEGSVPGASSGAADNTDGDAADAAEAAVRELLLPNGQSFKVAKEVLGVLVAEGAATLGEARLQVAKREAAAAAVAAAVAAREEAAAQAAAQAEAAAATAATAKGGKAAAKHSAAAAAAALADGGRGQDGEADPAEAAAAAVVMPLPPPEPPVGSDGRPQCIHTRLPEDMLTAALEQLQVRVALNPVLLALNRETKQLEARKQMTAPVHGYMHVRRG
eukprot:365672-Chlamydomonas_euryale.AAC.11